VVAPRALARRRRPEAASEIPGVFAGERLAHELRVPPFTAAQSAR
jgi:hypothetical protein